MQKRMIDANALMEKIDRMIDYCEKDSKVNGLTALFQVVDAILDCPTVDAVEVIRCRDCQMESTCKVTQRLGADGFCSYGERRKKMKHDLISRKALLEAYDKAHKGTPGGARKLIEEAPGVDAVDVVHGRYKQVDHDGSWRVDMCSICHKRVYYVDYDQPYQYCPNCGAKMDGEGNG